MNSVRLGSTRSAAVIATMGTALFLTLTCYGQGTLQFNFDGPPPQPPGTGTLVTHYYESGISFVPINPQPPINSRFGRIGADFGSGLPRSGFPENGSAYINAGLGGSLRFSFTNGSVFGLVSVDLAEFSTLYQEPLVVQFVGYHPDGSMVTTDLTTDGIIDGTGPVADFQTFYFGPEFSGLTRVEIPTYSWSLDNLVVSVPEPTGAILVLAGGLLLWRLRR